MRSQVPIDAPQGPTDRENHASEKTRWRGYSSCLEVLSRGRSGLRCKTAHRPQCRERLEGQLYGIRSMGRAIANDGPDRGAFGVWRPGPLEVLGPLGKAKASKD